MTEETDELYSAKKPGLKLPSKKIEVRLRMIRL